MKKVLAILLVLVLTAAMVTTTAMAAVNDAVAETALNNVLIQVMASDGGEIAVTDDGTEPVFDPSFSMDSTVENVPIGTAFAISAKADEGYKFLCWVDQDASTIYSTDATIHFEAAEDMNLIAVFDLDVERVSIFAKASAGGQIAMSEDGTDPEFVEGEHDTNDGGNFPVGNTIIFSAKADEGYKFICWMNEDTDEFVSLDSTICVEASEDLNLLAVFGLDVETVMIDVKASIGGQIAVSEDGSDPEFAEGEHDTNLIEFVPIGNTVLFSAKADEGYKFFYWLNTDTNDIYSEDSTINIEASEPLNLKAVFDLDVERVLIIAEALGGGCVGMSIDGEDPESFGGNAGGNFPVGDTVIFSAKADEGCKFICWLDADTEEAYSLEETIVVTAEQPLTLQAFFVDDVEAVTLKVNSEGKGEIAYEVDGGDPEFDSEYPLDSAYINVRPGDTVAVAAKADAGYQFVGWKDAATGKIVSTDAQYVVTVDKDLELIAVFETVGSGEKDDNPGGTAPATGDASATGLVVSVLLMTVSLFVIAAAVVFSRKRRNKA